MTSILIPTTGNREMLEPCLRSLLAAVRYEEMEILLLVDESHVGNLQWLTAIMEMASRVYLRVRPYSVSTSFNYSWVNNWGARQALGDLLCFLNDDTVVITPDWLERLAVRAILPGVAAAGPMLYYPNDTIQHAGIILGIGAANVAGHACCGLARGSAGYLGRAQREQDVSGVTAACMVMRKDLFLSVGGFDERLPVAFNDVDLCLRVRARGWRIIWTPTVELYHRESVSVDKAGARKRVREFSNAVAFMRKHWGAQLTQDPYYSPNLALTREFDLAFPPRVPLLSHSSFLQ
jgi:GT2 family glycosyltransferase